MSATAQPKTEPAFFETPGSPEKPLSRHSTKSIFGSTAGLLLLACVYSSPSHAILGGGVSGNKFDYAACAKIVEGKTHYEEAEKMLGGEPISTGKNVAGFFRHYQFEKQGGLGIRKFGIGIGGSKAKSYKCFVIHNADGVITAVDMQELGVDGANSSM
ncbi:MAG: hypothetical protein Cons2KO_27910 [Congregibacter sp.]